MSGTDIFYVIIIFLIFGFLIAFNQISISFANLKEQWPMIRCNPLAMPFALFISPLMKTLWFFNRGSGGKRDFEKLFFLKF